MALVTAGFVLRVVLIDNGGNTAVREYDLVATTAANAATAAATILAALDAVTDAVVKSYTIGEVFVEDALSLPASGVQIENLAEIVLQITDDPLKKVVISIPAPVAGLFVGSSGPSANIVDVNDSALIAYAQTWEGVGEATISDGESITLPIISGKRVHRASRKG
jgi:hypothetical protein